MGGCYDEGAGEGGGAEVGVYAEVLVGGAGGRVDQEVVQGTPFYVFEELFDEAVFFGTAPYYGRVAGGEHELYAHYAEIVGHPDGTPPRVTDVDGFGFYAHHFWDAGAADVGVHYADGVGWVGGEGVGEHGCEGGFADAAFAAED